MWVGPSGLVGLGSVRKQAEQAMRSILPQTVIQDMEAKQIEPFPFLSKVFWVMMFHYNNISPN